MGGMTDCRLHGRHRYRPSVERFDAQQQVAFRRFCGALLQTLTLTSAEGTCPPPTDAMLPAQSHRPEPPSLLQ